MTTAPVTQQGAATSGDGSDGNGANGASAPSGGVAEPRTFRRPSDPSTLLQYLPAIYQNDPFVGRLLRIFEDVRRPVQRTVDALPTYFDPRVAPVELRRLLSSWVGAEPRAGANRLGDVAWGRLIERELELHRWRGTKRGLRLALELATGHRPLITDYSTGLVLGSDASLGVNATLEVGQTLQLSVLFECESDEIDASMVDAIIRQHKPAHVAHSVTFRTA
jgi:phage tail-like protein